MKILITGGAGFIGSHLALRCLDAGHSVAVIDDLSTGSMENILPLKGRPGFQYFLDTVENRQLTAELVDTCDLVFHLAAAVGVKLIVESPVRTIETNVNTTALVLELAARKGKRVLVTSTSEVYGKRSAIPFREDDDLIMGPPTKGRWSYACSKALDEFLTIAYCKEKHLPATVVRLFNTVGPRQTGRYGMVIPNFVRQALRGEPITVYGDGSQRRCFLHVYDAVTALLALALTEKSVGGVFNIGNEEEVSITALAENVRGLAESSSGIVHVPYAEAYETGFEDMMRRVPDISKIRALIGFQTTRNLNQILNDVIADQRGRNRQNALSASA